MTAMPGTKLERAQAVVSTSMNDIVAQFLPGVRVTVIVRRPGFDDQDFLMTDDDLDQVASLIDRRRAR
jgi:hypothetical protein